MIRTSEQLKALVRNKSANSGQSQVMIANFFMERLLERISISKYRHNFILKGGMLVASLVGQHMRTTMDIDTTLKNIELTVKSAKSIIDDVISLPLDDGVSFSITDARDIMDDSEYGGVRLRLLAVLDGMRTYLKVDISTGDIITPEEITYRYKLMFDDKYISIKAYNIETVLAEKLETVLSRGTANSRLRDYYDLYVLQQDLFREIDTRLVAAAVKATCERRGSARLLPDGARILSEIQQDDVMIKLWSAYQNKFDYAAGIEWDCVMETITSLYKAFSIQDKKQTIQTRLGELAKQ